MPARIETDCNLKKTEPSFSSLTPVCRHVIERYMNRHFLVCDFRLPLLDSLDITPVIVSVIR